MEQENTMSEFRKVAKFKGTWLGRSGVSTDYLITSNPVGPRVVVHAWDDTGEVTVRGVDGDAYKNRRPFRETFSASFSRPSEAELSDAIANAKASLQ